MPSIQVGMGERVHNGANSTGCRSGLSSRTDLGNKQESQRKEVASAHRHEPSVLRPNGSRGSFRRVLSGWTAKRQPDLTQVMLIMSSDLVEFIPQRAHAVYTVDELKVATPLILHARIIDDCVANGLVHTPGEVQRQPR